MKSAKIRRHLTLLALVVALGVAVYLNWQYAAVNPEQTHLDTITVAAQDTSLPVEVSSTDNGVKEALPDKNYGEAQLVNADVDTGDFFDEVRLTRQKTRDAAIETLQQSLAGVQLNSEKKEALTDELAQAVNAMTVESDIEGMIKAKGFADCVAYVDGKSVQITVKSEDASLSAQQVTQIRDVVLSRVDTQAQNITVTEVK